RLQIVSLVLRFDYEVDESRGQHAVRVAVRSITGETGARSDLAKRVAFGPLPEHRRVSRRDGCVFNLRALPHAERTAFSSTPKLRPEPRTQERFPGVRLMHHADDWALAVVERDEGSPMQKTEDECAGAVDRIDDPREAIAAARRPMLFAIDAVSRIDARNLVANRPLGGAIRDRDGIKEAAAGTLVFDINRGAEVWQDDPTRDFTQVARERDVLGDFTVAKLLLRHWSSLRIEVGNKPINGLAELCDSGQAERFESASIAVVASTSFS